MAEAMETDAIKDEDLFNAAQSGNVDVFHELPAEQLKRIISIRNEDARSLLHVAAAAGHLQIVRILAGIDPSVSGVNDSDEEGWTPLHSAVSSGRDDIVEALLQAGADVSIANKGGRAALHYAASKGRLEIAHFLIVHGAKINQKDKLGCTPLHRAASTGHPELCEMLIEEGADVDATDKTGQTPLMHAVICSDKQICDGLKTMASTSHLDIEKFNGIEYKMWKLKMKDLLEERDQWRVVAKDTKPSDMFDED